MPPTMPPKSWAVNALVGTPRNEKPAYSLGETRVSVLHGIAWNQFLAEAVRFELTNGLTRRQFSRLVPSTTRPRFLSVQHYTYIIARRQLPGPHSAKFTAQRHRFPVNSGGLLGLDRYPVVAQGALEFDGWQRPRIQVSLHFVAAGTLQEGQLFERLDAFGDHLVLELLGDADDGAGDGAVVGVAGNAGGERAVDLQRVDREALQVGQAGITGAEVVQRQGHAQRRDAVHDADHAVDVVHQRAFGDFQFQPCGLEAVALQRGGHAQRQRRGEFARRDVDGQADRRQAGQLPRLRLRAGFLQHPLADLHHQPGGLGQRDEFGRRHQAALGMQPAHQRLGADDLAAADAELGLVVQQQLAVAERVAQPGFDAHAFLHALVHVLAVEGDVVVLAVAALLGAEHGDVGQPQQRFGVAAILRVDADADAAADPQIVAVDQEGLGQRGQQLVRHHARLVVLADVEQADGEFVAAQPRHQVLVAQHRAEAARHVAQQRVADLAAQGVVDQLETVQVDEQYAAVQLAALGHRQRLVDQLGQQRAVGQAGQRVVVGQVVDAFFGQLAFGDVGQVGDQADRALVRVDQRRQRQAGPKYFTGFFLAPHLHQTPALFEEGVVEGGVLVFVQEQDVAADRFDRAVAEQPLGALAPAGDEAAHVHRQHRFVDLVEDLRLVLQARFDLHVGVGRALRQRVHAQHAGGQRGQAGKVLAVALVIRPAADDEAAEDLLLVADFLLQSVGFASSFVRRRHVAAVRAGQHGARDTSELISQRRSAQTQHRVA